MSHDATLPLLRSKLADSWLVTYTDEIARILAGQWQRIATAAAQGTLSAISERVEEFRKEYYDVQYPLLLSMVSEGYDWASVEFGEKSALARLEAKVDVPVIELDGIVQARLSAPVERFLEGSVKGMTETTIKQIQENLDAAIIAQDTPAETARRLLQYAGVHVPARAKTIAQTATIWSFNAGALIRYRDAGAIALEWMVTEDDRTCEFCVPMDGARIPPENASFFEEGQMIEGNEGHTMGAFMTVEHPPLHANCRCTLLPVIL